MTIYFDMDGTIADFYGVNNWLDYLLDRDTFPYEMAQPLLRLSTLARLLNSLQRKGYKVGIISWLCKNSTEEYDEAVTAAKKAWLNKHLKSVRFDEIHILPYGTPKQNYATDKDVLFDDEENNRKNWTGKAFDVNNIIEVLKGFQNKILKSLLLAGRPIFITKFQIPS